MKKTLRPITMLPLALRTIEVAEITDVTPHLRRIRFVGQDLAGVDRDGCTMAPFHSPNFDDHVKLVFPGSNGTYGPPGVNTEEGVKWNPGAFERARDYTIRAQGQGWIDVEFVAHAGGLAATWAYRCEVGDTIYMGGPRGTRALPQQTSYLLIADETGLPAVGRFLEERQFTKHVDVLIEVPTDEDVQKLPGSPLTDVRWLVRAGAYQAGHSPLLERELRSLEFACDDVLVWAGMEAETLNGIRAYLTKELWIPSERLDLHGYWRR